MGSFNVTCALSGLPITDGAAVRAIVLFRPNVEAGHGLTHASSFFTPASLPMRASYSGYGGVETIEAGPIARAALAAFFDGIDSQVAATQAVDSLRWKPANASITRYGRAVDGKLHLALIREDVFEMAATLDVDQRSGDLARGLPLLDDKSITKDLISLAQREKEISSIDDTNSDLSNILRSVLKRQEPLALKTPLAYTDISAEGDITHAIFKPVFDALKTAAVTQESPDAALITEAKDLATLMQLNTFIMRGLGKTWGPSMRGIGGATPFRLQEVFAREVGSIATAERRWQQAAKRAESKGEKAPPRPTPKSR